MAGNKDYAAGLTVLHKATSQLSVTLIAFTHTVLSKPR